MEINTDTLIKLEIDNTDIFLEDYGSGKGKITISNTYGRNFSTYWGAMGCSLKDFIIQIDSDYFITKLFGPKSGKVLDVKKTFAAVRKHILNEILPWYKHMEFQKHMREVLNDFQHRIEESLSEEHFVETFTQNFTNKLDFSLISDEFDRKYVKEDFCFEQWYFIETKESPDSLWLRNLHKKLKKRLKNEKI